MPNNEVILRILSEDELMKQVTEFHQKHPNAMFAIVSASEKTRYLYCFSSGHSHRAARDRALRLHAEAKLPPPRFCFVLGRCRKRACHCGASYVRESIRSCGSGWCENDSRRFATSDFASMLAFATSEQRGFEEWMNPLMLPA